MPNYNPKIAVTYRWSFIACCFLLLGIVGCDSEEPECFEPIEVQAKNSFVIKRVVDTGYYVMTNTGSNDSIWIDTTLVSYRDSIFDHIAMIALDVDSAIGVLGIRTSLIGVPLNPFTDSQRYQILYDTANYNLSDTLTFYYQTSDHFISNNCGYTNYFQLDSARSTYNFLDSVVVQDRDVNNDNALRNLYLYFF